VVRIKTFSRGFIAFYICTGAFLTLLSYFELQLNLALVISEIISAPTFTVGFVAVVNINDTDSPLYQGMQRKTEKTKNCQKLHNW